MEIRPSEVRHARELLSDYPGAARLELPALSQAEERKIIELIRDTTRFYVSISRPVKVGETNWRRVGEKEGNSVWQLHLRSPGALEVRVWFSGFELDAGTSVKVYGADVGTGAAGEYTGRGWMDSIDFWSLSVRGDTAVVEFWVPSSPGASLEPADFPFRVSALDHRFRDNADDVPLLKHHSVGVPQVSTNCPFDNNICVFPDGVERWRGVARIIHTPPPGQGNGGQCTAGLINTRGANADGVYLLTAYHCIEGGVRPETARGTPLNLLSFIGDSPCADPSQVIRGQGAQFIAAAGRGDYALLWLRNSDLVSQAPSSILQLGWTTATLSVSSRIETLHHAQGTDQNYARAVITGLSYQITYEGDFNLFGGCFNPAGCSHYTIYSVIGGLSGGASGSPLWSRENSGTFITGVYTHGLGCAGHASRLTKIYEDGRVRCALEHGGAYHPDGSADCDDTARPVYIGRALGLRLRVFLEGALPL